MVIRDREEQHWGLKNRALGIERESVKVEREGIKGGRHDWGRGASKIEGRGIQD